MAILVFPPVSLSEASEEALALMHKISDCRHEGLRFIHVKYDFLFSFFLKTAANLT